MVKITIKDIKKPKRMITQVIKINGVKFIVARPEGTTKLPDKFKSWW